jgi:ABC-type branched-subunit amino acid transport system substrate-binding protein
MQNSGVLREAGEAANGAVYILAAPPAGEAAQRFSKAYAAKFGHAPELFAAEGYDIVRLIADAIAGAKGTPISGVSSVKFATTPVHRER